MCHHPSGDGETVTIFRRLFQKSSGRAPELKMLATGEIVSNPYQPRLEVDFDSDSFARLQESIRHYGVIVPILATARHGKFVLVAGQRRVAACRRLGMKRVPGIVRRLTDVQIIEISYLENLHRRELSNVEISRTFEHLVQELPHLSREELSLRLGRDYREVPRGSRLVRLHPLLQEAMRREMITEDHALALGSIAEERLLIELLRRVHFCRLSVSDTALLVAEVRLRQPARRRPSQEEE